MLSTVIEPTSPLVTSPGAARTKIAVRGLWMTFPAKGRQEQPVHVLEDINLEVRDGEFVCLVGPSGCGKSTLLNIAGGFLNATQGEISADG